MPYALTELNSPRPAGPPTTPGTRSGGSTHDIDLDALRQRLAPDLG
jgi:hypothetical protein